MATGDRPFAQALSRVIALQREPFTGLGQAPLTDTPAFTLGVLAGPYTAIPGSGAKLGGVGHRPLVSPRCNE